MKILRISLLFLVLFGLMGCGTPGSTVRWYAPATWFSAAPASRVDNANKKEDAAREAVIKAAQKTAHETAIALSDAPASRPVEVATNTNASTVALLDQAAGPLSAQEVEKLRALIKGLMSDNAQIRAEAEKQRAKELSNIAEVSARLAKAESATQIANDKLRAAFERENALANELRSQRALFWIAVSVGSLLALGWLYVQFTIGGVPNAIGLAMRDLKMKNPSLAEQVAPFYAKHLNRREQKIISDKAR